MKSYLGFLSVSYVTAMIFESIANTVGDGKLFQQPGWPLFFILWYGTIYTLTFLAFRNRSLWAPVITWAVLGPIVEAVVFKRLNIIVDPIIYGLMFLVPFWFYHHQFVGRRSAHA